MNHIKESKGKGLGLFSGKIYEQGEIVEECKFTSIPEYVFYQLPPYEQRRIFYNDGFMLPTGNIVYVNHEDGGNCNVLFNKEKIVLCAKYTIRKGQEITIDYGNDINTSFTI